MKTLLAALSMIPGLTATPPLPPRTVDSSAYSGFEISLIEKYADADKDDERATCYKVNVKNIGEGYMSGVFFNFSTGFQAYNYEYEGIVSNDQVIAPHQEITLVVSANYNTDSLDNFKITASAYIDFTDELKVTGTKEITYIENERGYFNYIDMSFGHAERDEYCYGAIIKAYVDEKEAFFVVNECDNFGFFTTKEVKGNENNEAEVVKLLKTKYRAYEQENFQSNFFYRVSKGCHGSIIFGVPAMTSLGLITTFVVALKRAYKKKYSK